MESRIQPQRPHRLPPHGGSFIFDTLAIPTGNGPNNYHVKIGVGWGGYPNPSGVC